jgi:hypothetical protein
MPSVSLRQSGPQRDRGCVQGGQIITELHLESLLAAGASILAEQGAARAAEQFRARQVHAEGAAPF